MVPSVPHPHPPTQPPHSWVPNTDTLHALIREYRDARKIPLNMEHRMMLGMAPDYDHLTVIQKVEVFEHALEGTAGDDLHKVLWLKSRNSEVWLDRRTSYTRTLAVMSMVGYLLGLGDRHPSNIMLDRYGGGVGGGGGTGGIRFGEEGGVGGVWVGLLFCGLFWGGGGREGNTYTCVHTKKYTHMNTHPKTHGHQNTHQNTRTPTHTQKHTKNTHQNTRTPTHTQKHTKNTHQKPHTQVFWQDPSH